MNKSQLVDALTDRLGDRRTAAGAVDAFLEIVVDTVRSGEPVSLAGFGVFESRARAARLGRNPRTGESVAVPATTVPAFRPGTGFRQAVAGMADAPADDVATTRRRTRAAGDANGSLNGAVDAVTVPTTVLASTVPDTMQDGTAKAGAKDKGKKARGSAPKNDGKNDKGKKKGKGKKGKN